MLLLLGGLLALCADIKVDNPPEQKTARPVYPPGVCYLNKGHFVFFFNTIFENTGRKAEYFDYIKRFRVCLTNGYENFSGKDLEELHAAGCEVFLYLWFNGFHEKELAPKENDAYIRRFPFMTRAFREIYAPPEWVLNHGNPLQGSGAAHPAYFFDYNNPEFRKYYVDFIKPALSELSTQSSGEGHEALKEVEDFWWQPASMGNDG